MTLFINRRNLILGSAAAGLGVSANRWSARAAEPFKVAFVYLGPIGDHGWTYQHEEGRRALQAKLGDKVKTSYVENVAEGPDAERVIRQLASAGNDLIFTTSFGYMNPTIRVAKEFPKVRFEHATGYMTAPNVSVYNARFYEGRAVIGTIAGYMSKTGVAGYIGSFPIPEVVMGINAFTLAAQKVRPDFKTKVIWVNSWFDPGKEADAAKSQIDQGADILSQHTDSPAVLQTAENRGVLAFGQSSDMRNFAPNAQLTSIVDNWGDYYIERTQAAIEGSWKTSNVWYGLKEGMVKIAPYGPKISDAARAAAEKIRADIISGAMHPFTGPIKDNKGQTKVAAGATIADAELQKLNWYVDGVQA
jgi:simple sugar transport system substrate-binding protein